MPGIPGTENAESGAFGGAVMTSLWSSSAGHHVLSDDAFSRCHCQLPVADPYSSGGFRLPVAQRGETYDKAGEAARTR